MRTPGPLTGGGGLWGRERWEGRIRKGASVRSEPQRKGGEKRPHHAPHPKTASPTEAAGSAPVFGERRVGVGRGVRQQDAPLTDSPRSMPEGAWLRRRQQAFRHTCHSPGGSRPQLSLGPLLCRSAPAWLRRASVSENSGLLHDCVGPSFS